MSHVGRANFGTGLALPAFAKINLTLEILGHRPDGYTEIRTLYQTITLHDRLRLRLARPSGDIIVRVPGGGAPAGRDNLIYRALECTRRTLGIRRGVEVELEKDIPAARGLGGGSSDAAAAMVGLLRLVGVRLSAEEIARLGAQTGADVPYFFYGGRALGVGRGDDVYPLQDATPAWVVLVSPPFVIPTRQAYRWAAGREKLTLRRGAAIIGSRRLPPDALWAAGNDFEAVVFPRFPELARIKRALLRAGARRAGLSGSGSTVFGLFSRRAAAERAAAVWARRATVFLGETLSRARYRQALGLDAVFRDGESSSGRTSAFGAEDPGSNPGSPASSVVFGAAWVGSGQGVKA